MKRLLSRYAKSSKLSERQLRALAKLVAADLTASQIALVSGLNRNTVNRYLRLLRLRMAAWCGTRRPFFGVVEADESLFGARRVKGQRGPGAGGKAIVFGIFQRLGWVWHEVVPDASSHSLHWLFVATWRLRR